MTNDNEYWVLLLAAGTVQVQLIRHNRWADLPPDGNILFVGKSVLSCERYLKSLLSATKSGDDGLSNTMTDVPL